MMTLFNEIANDLGHNLLLAFNWQKINRKIYSANHFCWFNP